MWQLIVQCDKFTNSKLRRSQYISCNVLQPPPTSGYVQCIHKALYRTKYIIIWGHSILLFWHKRCCCSQLTFRQTTVNDMSGSLFSLFISFLLFFVVSFFPFVFSTVNDPHRTLVWIKILFYQSSGKYPKIKGMPLSPGG